MWSFNVTTGSVKVDLTDPQTSSIFWTVGPRSVGQWHLNVTSFASFNWTAPASRLFNGSRKSKSLVMVDEFVLEHFSTFHVRHTCMGLEYPRASTYHCPVTHLVCLMGE